MAGWGYRNGKVRDRMKRKPVSREEFEEFKEWQGDINVDDAAAITELRRALAALTEQVEGLKGSSWPSSKETHWKHRAEAAEARARVKELEGEITRYLVVLERGDFADTDELERLVGFRAGKEGQA